MASKIIPRDYAAWLETLKGRIAAARGRAALAVNADLIRLYHGIGREILERQTRHGWGAKVIIRVADDLKTAFPDMKGFSPRNVKYMRYFAEHCPDAQFGQQPAAQLPWFHIVTLLTKAQPVNREWYAVQAVTQGWSRLALEQHLQTRLHERQGAAVTNFALRLSAPDSALARETLKDPYLFDFLGLADDAHEREIENALIRHITRFLIELGDDKPTIGLLLCRKQNRLVAQYAVTGIDKPIGIAEFHLLRNLPEPLADNLPSIEEIEAELANEPLPETPEPEGEA